MSSVQPIGPGDVRAAIAVAAQTTGVDFGYLLGQAKIESSLDPRAWAGTSSAAGLYQFTGGTWLTTLDSHGAQHGLGWAEAAITGGKVGDKALRAQIMALRFDPQVSALMAGELANDNRAVLTTALGREPDAGELYLAHFLGAEGATKFLTALAADPAQSAAALMPKPAAANRAIFFGAGGAPRSLSGVMDLLRGKLEAAMGDGTAAEFPEFEGPRGWGPGGWAGTAAGAPPWAGKSGGPKALDMAPPRSSMADTLRDTFAISDSAGGVPDHIRAAYGRLQSFGL